MRGSDTALTAEREGKRGQKEGKIKIKKRKETEERRKEGNISHSRVTNTRTSTTHETTHCNLKRHNVASYVHN